MVSRSEIIWLETWSQKRPNWAASAGVELARLGRGRITLAAFEYFTFCPSDPILKHVHDNNPVVWYICRADSPKVPCDLCPDQSSSLNLPTTWPGDTFRLLFTIKEWNGGWKQIGLFVRIRIRISQVSAFLLHSLPFPSLVMTVQASYMDLRCLFV